MGKYIIDSHNDLWIINDLWMPSSKESAVFDFIKSKIKVKNIVSTSRHTAIIDEKNQLYYARVGKDEFKGVIDDRFIKIKRQFESLYTMLNSIILVDIKGNIYGLGSNNFHQLGCKVPDEKFEIAPIHGVSNISRVSIGNGYTILIDFNGNVYGSGKFGSNSQYVKNFIKIECDFYIVDVSCADNTIYMLDIDGIVRYLPYQKYILAKFYLFCSLGELPKMTKILYHYGIDIEGNLWDLCRSSKVIMEYKILDIGYFEGFADRSYIIIQDENNNLYCAKGSHRSNINFLKVKFPFEINTLSLNNTKISSYNPKSARNL